MSNLSEYFAANRYKPQYEIGDRISGRWNKIPFIGTVGNDTLISELEGPRISVHLDLPIRYENVTHYTIIVTHSAVKKLKEYKC